MNHSPETRFTEAVSQDPDEAFQASLEKAREAEEARQTALALATRVAGPVFQASPDAIGLPQEHPAYADQDCRMCNSKGWHLVHVQPIQSPDGNIYTKFHVVCACVNKGYVKTRKRVEAGMATGMGLAAAAKAARYRGPVYPPPITAEQVAAEVSGRLVAAPADPSTIDPDAAYTT